MPALHSPGDEPTFEEFYVRHFVALKGWAVKRIGARPDEAEEVVQEAMAQACQNWHTIRFPLAWVKKAANTELTKLINRRQQEARLRLTLGLDDPVDPMPWRESEQVREALRSLPEAQREVFAFVYDGYEPHEIARLVNKSPETVRTNLREARRRLRAAFASRDRSDLTTREGQRDA